LSFRKYRIYVIPGTCGIAAVISYRGTGSSVMESVLWLFAGAALQPRHLAIYRRVVTSFCGQIPYEAWISVLTEQWRHKLRGGFGVCLHSEAEWERTVRGGLEIPDKPLFLHGNVLLRATKPPVVRNPQPKRLYPWGEEPDPNRGLPRTSPAQAAQGNALQAPVAGLARSAARGKIPIQSVVASILGWREHVRGNTVGLQKAILKNVPVEISSHFL